MLIAGIIIAQYLGRDLFGEYGIAKTTMLYVGGFANLGLDKSMTAYIARSLTTSPQNIRSLIIDAVQINIGTSFLLAVALAVFAEPVAIYLDAPGLTMCFKMLAVIVIFRSLQVTGSGILGGFGKYKIIGINNILSSIIMVVCAATFTYYWGLIGALSALAFSQAVNTTLNFISIYKYTKTLPKQVRYSQKKELVIVSSPLALVDISYTITHWFSAAILTKFAGLGQMGLYSAASQWYAVILIIPGLLINVILSHLSKTSADEVAHYRLLKRLLLVNLVCTALPFTIVYVLAPWITSLYGSSFANLTSILRVLMFAAFFQCISNVFYSEFIAKKYTWQVFIIRLLRDILSLGLCYWLIMRFGRETGAIDYAVSSVIMSALYLIALYLGYKIIERRKLKS